jgi:DNA adenine methylase
MILRQTTPLRYPGGKQRLSPFIAEVLECNGLLGAHYAEPYAGGAGVATDLLLNGAVSHVHLNDSSRCIFAFWHTLLHDPEYLCRRIATASLTIQDWQRHREVVRHPEEHDLVEVGFSTFYLNRCNRSGVLTAGVIGGLAQSGRWRMDARFSRNELIRRVEAIAALRDHISATNLDAEDFLSGHGSDHLPGETFVYCDPPYYERAQRLYLDSYDRSDHARLAGFIQAGLPWKWAVSYDAHEDIFDLYRGRQHFAYDLQYSATRVCKGREVFIFADAVTVPRQSAIAAVDCALPAVI